MSPKVIGFLVFAGMIVGFFSLATGVGVNLFFFVAGFALLAIARHAYNRQAGDWIPLVFLGFVMIVTSIGEAVS